MQWSSVNTKSILSTNTGQIWGSRFLWTGWSWMSHRMHRRGHSITLPLFPSSVIHHCVFGKLTFCNGKRIPLTLACIRGGMGSSLDSGTQQFRWSIYVAQELIHGCGCRLCPDAFFGSGQREDVLFNQYGSKSICSQEPQLWITWGMSDSWDVTICLTRESVNQGQTGAPFVKSDKNLSSHRNTKCSLTNLTHVSNRTLNPKFECVRVGGVGLCCCAWEYFYFYFFGRGTQTKKQKIMRSVLSFCREWNMSHLHAAIVRFMPIEYLDLLQNAVKKLRAGRIFLSKSSICIWWIRRNSGQFNLLWRRSITMRSFHFGFWPIYLIQKTSSVNCSWPHAILYNRSTMRVQQHNLLRVQQLPFTKSLLWQRVRVRAQRTKQSSSSKPDRKGRNDFFLLAGQQRKHLTVTFYSFKIQFLNWIDERKHNRHGYLHSPTLI